MYIHTHTTQVGMYTDLCRCMPNFQACHLVTFGRASWNGPQNLQLSSLSPRRNGENLVLWDGTFAPWNPKDLVRWCARMSMSKHVAEWTDALQCFAMNYLWVLRTRKKRTSQMLCRLQRCCDYCLWFRKIIAQIYIKYRATSKIHWSMTLGIDLCPRRPLYHFVSFVSSQSIKTGVHIPYRSMNN